MIRYTLHCANDHGFDSWFRDSAAYDDLAAAGQVACPTCGSVVVGKALMAPSVVTSRSKAKPEAVSAPTPAAAATPVPPSVVASEAPPQPVALMDDRARELRAAMRELYVKITGSADNVGRDFATEARAIHEGDAPARSIYGEATRTEVAALLEDGIPLMPLPVPPDDHH